MLRNKHLLLTVGLVGVGTIVSNAQISTAGSSLTVSAKLDRANQPTSADYAGGATPERPPEALTPSSHNKEDSPAADREARLEQRLAAQEQQISELRAALEKQAQLLEKALSHSASVASPTPGTIQVASLAPVLPAPVNADPAPVVLPSPASVPARQDSAQGYAQKVDQLDKSIQALDRGLAGFKFSGDLRIRSDGIFRSANDVAPAVQNVRERYRLRFNVDKAINRQFDTHFQLASGLFNNPINFDDDFTANNARGPVFISEVWADWHPNQNVAIRVGKMPSIFQDNTRFMWDEDVRFNGVSEIIKTPLSNNALGITSIEMRAGQYVLNNPNVPALPSASACASKPQVITSLPATITTPAVPPVNCAYLAAGYQPGENLGASNLFEQGFQINGRIKEGWSQYVFADFNLYRNANQIQLGSTTAGAIAVGSPLSGVVLNLPFVGIGNATTTPNGATYTAAHYQVGRVAYRLTYSGWKLRGEAFPVFIDVQGVRNFGTSFLRNGWNAILDGGNIKRAGDVHFMYQYALKEGNSLISQFTDDNLGTGTGVNIRTHLIRFDVGLASFLQWQNLLYIQNEVSSNDPARKFFVPVPAGAATQYRVQSQFQFVF